MSKFVKYSKLPGAESAAEFDFSSPFTYGIEDEDKTRHGKKYKSAFTFTNLNHKKLRREPDPSSSVFSICCHVMVVGLCYLLAICTLPFSLIFCIKFIGQSEKIVIFRIGKLIAPRGPGGMTFVLPCVDRIVRVNIAGKAFNVPPQKIFTSDNCVIEVGADVFYRVVNAIVSITHIENLNHSLRVLAQIALMNQLSKRTLAEIEAEKNIINAAIQEDLCKVTMNWGVEVGHIDISHVTLIHRAPETSNPSSLLFPPGLGVPPQHQSILNMLAGTIQQAAAPKPPTSTVTVVNMEDEPKASPTSLKEITYPTPEVSYPTPKKLINLLRPQLNEYLVRDFQSVYQFIVQGEDGGMFFLDLKHGQGSVGEGHPSSEPDVTLTLSTEDMQRLFEGSLKPFQAYMSSRLQLNGDLAAAMKLEDLIDRLRKSLIRRVPDDVYNGKVQIV
ncbi:stomatin-like protein 1 [Lineus longissimus]|uniref:stomatin-like protein 1 n=1 Tax=Lineus longissimus TaxID=88925 RepID=UPI002B4C6E04